MKRYQWYYNRFANQERSGRKAEDIKSKIEKDIKLLLEAGLSDLEFLWNAYHTVIQCRNVLKWSYVYAFYEE